MKSYTPDFHIQTAENLKAALVLLGSTKVKWKPIAGGTDLMVLFEAGKLPQGHYLNIWGLKELKGIKETSTEIEIGALTTYSEILENVLIQKEFSLLCEAARLTGAVAIQNRGTLGGNIVNASPAADSPPALLVYETEVELVSTKGSRWITYSDFHKAYKKMEIRSDELLTRIRIKRNTQGTQQYYRKVGTRKAQAISKVCIAALAKNNAGTISKFRLAFGSVAATPLRCVKTEQVIEGQKLTPALIDKCIVELSKEISPIDDIRSNKVYRALVAANLLRDFLGHL